MDAQHERCPFLVPVVADQLFVYPVVAYCRRPSGEVRVPATQTLAGVCMSRYESCAGYRASAVRDEGAAGD